MVGQGSNTEVPEGLAASRAEPSIFIVIPAFNEAAVIERVVEAVRSRFPRTVVVDDGSTDDTALAARRAGATVVSHLINRGQGAALRTGFEYVLTRGADVIVTFDADGQHQVEDIAALVAPITERGFDVVLGSRFMAAGSQVPMGRKIVLKCAVWFTRLASQIRVTDAHSGLRAMSRRAAECIRIRQDGMAHASEILDEIVRHRLQFCEVPVRVLYTPYSQQKGQSSLAAFRIALDFLLGKWRN